MRRYRGALASAALLLMGIGFPAVAQPQDFAIRNHGNVDIEEVYVSVQYRQFWGGDRLGSQDIAPGQEATVSLSEFGAECFFDIRVVDANGQVREYWGHNTCLNARVDFP